MNPNLKTPELALDSGQILRLDDVEGLRILARTGTVWVTEEGSPKDHIVGPGDTLIVAHSGLTLVQALQPAWISLGDGPRAANDSELEAPYGHWDADEYLSDLRHRIQSRYY